MEAPFLRNSRTSSSSLPNCIQVSNGVVFCIKSIDIVTSLVLIISTFIVLKEIEGEPSEVIWITVYTCACCFNIPTLCRQLKHLHENSEIRNNCLSTMVEVFLAVWTVAFFFVFRSSSLDHSSQLYSLCVIFLIIGCIRYVIPAVVLTTFGCCALCFAIADTSDQDIV